jgi:hypothetical protein
MEWILMEKFDIKAFCEAYLLALLSTPKAEPANKGAEQ